jgi:hypothetical protein
VKAKGKGKYASMSEQEEETNISIIERFKVEEQLQTKLLLLINICCYTTSCAIFSS